MEGGVQVPLPHQPRRSLQIARKNFPALIIKRQIVAATRIGPALVRAAVGQLGNGGSCAPRRCVRKDIQGLLKRRDGLGERVIVAERQIDPAPGKGKPVPLKAVPEDVAPPQKADRSQINARVVVLV